METQVEQASITELHNPVAMLKSIRAQIKALEQAEVAAKDQINYMLDQRGVEELVFGDDKVVRTVTTRNTFDSTSFKSSNIDLYNQYLTEKVIVTLKVL